MKKKIENPFTRDDWSAESLQQSWGIISKLATEKYGLTYYKPSFEVVNFEDMLHIYTGSLPIMYDHWSFGKSYIELHKQYMNDRMGVAYEVIFNTSPALCYLLEHNSPTMQALVQCHASVGHSAFFRNNVFFKEMTNAATIIPFLKNAKAFIKECEETYGAYPVEELLDSCHALSLYAIDRMPAKEKTRKEKDKIRTARADQRDSEYNIATDTIKLKAPGRTSTSTRFREENILKFIGKYSPALKQWQREVIAIYCQIQQYLYPQMLTKVSNEGFACQDGESEYLSETGFRKISEYRGEKIAQYNADGTIEFVMPDKFHKYENAELVEIKSEGVNQCVTPNHRIIYNSARWNLNEIRADELTTSINRYFITGGALNKDSTLKLTNAELRVMAAIISDGHFNPNSTTKHCQIAFVKQRKIDRMKLLLEDANISYKLQKQTQNRTCFSFYAPERSKELADYYGADHPQLEVILDEYVHWDGANENGRKVFFGINKANMDFIQYAISVTDGKARMSSYQPKGNRQRIYIVEALRSKITTLSGGTITKREGKHSVYCFSVPSGMFVTRRENVVNVTGNSFWHHTLMNDLMDSGLIPPGGGLEFIHSHCSVLGQRDFDQPGYSGFNPYKLGFSIYEDIRRICTDPTEEDKQWFPGLIGKDWVEEVKFAAYNFKDESFINQYLSPKVIRDMKLFVVNDNEKEEDMGISDIHDDEGYKNIRTKLADKYNHFSNIPDIYIEGWDSKKSRTLYLVYKIKDGRMLDESGRSDWAALHIKNLWPFKIVFKCLLDDGRVVIDEL